MQVVPNIRPFHVFVAPYVSWLSMFDHQVFCAQSLAYSTNAAPHKHPMQAQRWGTELVTEDVVRVDTSVRPFVVETEEVSVRAHAIIMATGATARRLGIPSEREFWCRGISACAICDGASPLFTGQEVAVVGAGAHPTICQAFLCVFCPALDL